MASLRKLFLALGPFLVGIQRVHFTYYLLFLISCRNISSRCYTTQLYRAKQKVKQVTGTQISSERSKSPSREAQDPRICGVNLTILWPFTRDCGTLFLCLQGLQNVVYMLLHLQLALLASFPVSLWKKICSNTRATSWQHWGLRGWAEFYSVNTHTVSRRRERGCDQSPLRQRKEKTPKKFKKQKLRRSEKHSWWWSDNEGIELNGGKKIREVNAIFPVADLKKSQD